jgi:hypothetical protein
MPNNATTVTAHFAFSGTANASISPAFATFTKGVDGDLTVRLNPGGFTLGRISGNRHTLQHNRDFSVSHRDYTFAAAFLNELPVGENIIEFEMTGGVNPRLTVTVREGTGTGTGTGSNANAPAPPAVAPSADIPAPTPATSIPAAVGPPPEPETEAEPDDHPRVFSDMSADGLPPLRVRINGRTVNFDGRGALLIGDTGYVPLRETFERMGYRVEWESDKGQAKLTRFGSVLEIEPDSAYFFANGFAQSMAAPAQMVNGQLMVPFVEIIERIGGRAYRDENHTIHIFFSW